MGGGYVSRNAVPFFDNEVRRNDVARKRLTGERIDNCQDALEERIRRIEQLAEVAVAHRQRRHRDDARLHLEKSTHSCAPKKNSFCFNPLTGTGPPNA